MSGKGQCVVGFQWEPVHRSTSVSNGRRQMAVRNGPGPVGGGVPSFSST